MGNSTVTPVAPATSRAPIIPPIPRASASVFNPDSPIESPTPYISSYPRISAVPVPSTNVDVSDIPTNPVPSPTFAFPVVSPTFAIPVVSPTTTLIASSIPVVPVITPSPTVPIVSPKPTIPVVSPTAGSPIDSTTPMVPVVASTPEIPIESTTLTGPVGPWTPEISIVAPTAAVPEVSSPPENSIVSPNRAVPVVSWAPEILTVDPTAAVPEVSSTSEAQVISSSSEVRIGSPTSNIHGIPVISPDTSAVSPTLDHPDTPRRSPAPTAAVIPVKSIIPPPEIRPTAPITCDVSTSPLAPFVPKPPVISTTFRPAKAVPKRTVWKSSVPLSTSTFKPAKPSSFAPAERLDKWNKVERKQQEKPKILSYTTLAVQTSDLYKPTTSTKSTNTDQQITSVIPDIIAVPSFSLRSTAVSNPRQEGYILSERTQSIHNDFSIIKYYLPFKERKQSVGNHTKATMSKMDTRLKKTPLPTPSLLFLNKNFSDGTHETHNDSADAPSFGSLGLQNEFEPEPIGQSLTELRLHEKQLQRKLHQSTLFPYDNFDSNDPYQFVSSTVISQPNLSTIEQSPVQNNRQPVASILKRPSSPINNNPYPTETNSNVVQELPKSDFETPFTVSLNLPSTSSSKKANQSITRSFKLFNRKK